MFKGNVTLENGKLSQFEYETAEQLVTILKGLEAVHVSPSTNDTRVTPAVQPFAGLGMENAWTETEICFVAKELVATGGKHGTLKDTIKNVLAVNRRRTSSSVYVMVTRVKLYLFAGKVRGTGISRHVKDTLKKNGYEPGSQVQIKGINATQAAKNGSPKKKKYAPKAAWSDNDLVAIGNIVQSNITLQRGLSRMAMGYLKKAGDAKKYKASMVYNLVYEIKKYFNRTGTHLGLHSMEVLKAHGLVPSVQGLRTMQGDITSATGEDA
jgi:hypothetical protein